LIFSNQILSEAMTEILWRSSCDLGEAPVWHQERRSCFWVDVNGKIVYEYSWHQKTVSKYQLEYSVSLVIPSSNNEIILALQGGIAKFNLLTFTLTWITTLDVDWREFRCNDGGIDAKGRLWVSTMHIAHQTDAGAIYCVGISGEAKKMISDISIPNGIVWSADRNHLYFTDSIKAEIYGYRFDDELDLIADKKLLASIPRALGLPDGMAIDEEGMLWVALWGGYGVGRFNPDTGQMIDFIDIPVPHVTCCCFGGDQLDQLIITTARAEMSAEALLKYPDSGHVFTVKMNVSGLKNYQSGL
jgi:sugar lactone lactonase YvrE